MTTINPLPPSPPTGDDMPVPPMALPPLPAYPAQGTDVQRSDWLRLADLYQREAQRLTCWQARPAASMGPTVEAVLAAWAAHDAALDRLTAVLGALQLPTSIGGGGGGDEGLTMKDVAVVKGVAEALKGA